MGRFDRWLRKAVQAAPEETLLAALGGSTPAGGERSGGRPCVVVATSGHVVRYVPRLRRPEVTTITAADITDVSVSADERTLTIGSADGSSLVVDRISDPVALAALVSVLERLGGRPRSAPPMPARPGHGHVRAVRPSGA